MGDVVKITDFDLGGLGWGLRVCTVNKFLVSVVGSGITFSNKGLENVGLGWRLWDIVRFVCFFLVLMREEEDGLNTIGWGYF